MASGLPLGGLVPQALLAQQQLATRGPANVVGQQMRAGGVNAATAQQVQAAQAAQAAENAKKLANKKRKAMDKPASEQALHLIPESPLFNSLVIQDHQVNEIIKRQRLELQATVNPLECPVHKRLRVYIYNTHSHQHSAETAEQQQGVNADSKEPPQWTLVVWGRLENPDPPAAPKALPAAGTAEPGRSTAGNAAALAGPTPPGSTSGNVAGGGAAAAAAAGGSGVSEQAGAAAVNVSTLPPQSAAPHSTQKQPFSAFFKRMDFQLDPEQYPDSCTITWEKMQHRGAHKDKFEIKRIGSQPCQVTITFEQDFVPPVYKVDPQLAEVLGMSFGQQQMVLTRLYSYIISVRQQPDLSQLQLDEQLEAIFGTKQLAAAALPQALGRLLQPLEAVTVTHTITTSGPSPGPVTCVDFDVLLPVKLQEKVAPVIDSLLDDKQFEVLDQKIDASLAKLFEARRRRDMYLGFAEDPVTFLNTIIASQARELRVSRNNQNVAIERRSDLYKDKWVEEAALRYLGRKSKQDGLFPALQVQGQTGPQ